MAQVVDQLMKQVNLGWVMQKSMVGKSLKEGEVAWSSMAVVEVALSKYTTKLINKLQLSQKSFQESTVNVIF